MGDTQSAQITDISHIMSSFNELNSPTKVHALMEMVKVCSYQEQLDFEKKLLEHFHRDFITLLPSDLSTKIISYLRMADAINCLAISKDWNRIVNGCSSYWESKARQLGMCQPFIKSRLSDPRCKLPYLCMAALNHQEHMKSLVPHSFPISRSLTGIGSSYQYAGNGVFLQYKEANSQAQVSVECMNTPQSAVQITSFDVAPLRGRIKWAAASSDYVLWKQMDGTWRGCSTKGLIPESNMWEDDPMPQGFHSISFCSKCHLVAVMSQAEDDCEVWDLQVIKLYSDSSSEAATLRKMVYPIPLPGVNNSWEKKRYFLGGEVTLLPGSLEVDTSGFCKSHSVLLQIESTLAVHKLKMIDEMESSLVISQLLPNSLLSKPLRVFSPKQPDQPLGLMDFSGSKNRPTFCLSADLQRVAMIHESYLYIWNLGTFEEENFVDLFGLNLPSDTKVIAVGGVYAVIVSNSKGVCYVILTTTGEIILQNSLLTDSTEKHKFEFFAPLNEDWLDSFVYFDFWPLGLVIDSKTVKDKEELELNAMVGVRSRQRPEFKGLSLSTNT